MKKFATQKNKKENIEKMKIPRRFIDHKTRRTFLYISGEATNTRKIHKKKELEMR